MEHANAKHTYTKVRAAVQIMTVEHEKVVNGTQEIIEQFNVLAVITDAQNLRDRICAGLRDICIKALVNPKAELDKKIHDETQANRLWHSGAKTFDQVMKQAVKLLVVPANADMKKLLTYYKKVN